MIGLNLNVEEQLTDTDNFSSPTKSIRKQESSPKKVHFSKKRIGPYSYHLKNVIGCGFSSVVYKGVKNDDKTYKVALKVIQLTHLSKHRRHLLSNQVKLMKKLNHPNIVRLLDVYETVNNCYIISEFCEGGSLQNHIDAKDNINAGTVIQQIGNACQYMASMKIIHRDLKPANIYLRKNVWKLGDFGFSQQLPDYNAFIKEDYLVGSPIFMPLQSLENKIYSSKCDSFALGVFIFYLLTGNYPWPCQDQKNLIHQLTNFCPNQKYLNLLPPKIKYYALALLNPEMTERIHLLDCDFQAFSHIKKLKRIQQQLICLKPYFQEQLNLIKFIYHLLQNYKRYENLNQDLKIYMQIHLAKMIGMVQWDSQLEKNRVTQEYNISELSLSFENQDCYWLNNCLKDIIILLKDKYQTSYQILLQKLLLYQQIVECLLHKQLEEILNYIRQLPLDTNFAILTPNQQSINQMLSTIDFYQL